MTVPVIRARAAMARSVSACGDVGDQDVRAVDRLADERAGRAGGERLGDELMPVGDAPRHRHEQVARPDFAAVEGHAGDLERRAGAARRSRLRSRREVHEVRAVMPRTPAPR